MILKVLLICLISLLLGYLVINKNSNGYKFISENKLDNTKNYTLRWSLPITENIALNNEMKKMVKENISLFKDFVKDNIKIPELKDRVYDFRSDFTSELYKDVISFHFITLMYTGGAHYIRSDNMYNYNYKKNKQVYLKDFFKKNSNYLDIISKLAFEEVMKYSKENDLNLDEIWVKGGTSPTRDNFLLFNFNEEGLRIIFPPYQVGPWADGEIDITIPYDKINDILKVRDKQKLLFTAD